jgi:hypothetical protein
MHTHLDSSVTPARLVTNSLHSQQESSIRSCWCTSYTSISPPASTHHYHSNRFATISSQLLTTSTLICNANLLIARPVILGLLFPKDKCDTNLDFLLGNSPASEFYIATFRNALSNLHRQVGEQLFTYLPMKMEQTECSETSAYKIQMPGNFPEENIQQM